MPLRAKIESAYQLFLLGRLDRPLNLNVYRGDEDATQRRPCVIVQAKSGEPAELIGAGDNRFFNVSIMVKGEAELKIKSLDPVAVQTANAQWVFSALQVDDLAEQLSALVPDLTIFSPISDEGEDPDIQGRAFVDGLLQKLYCCGSRIT